MAQSGWRRHAAVLSATLVLLLSGILPTFAEGHDEGAEAEPATEVVESDTEAGDEESEPGDEGSEPGDEGSEPGDEASHSESDDAESDDAADDTVESDDASGDASGGSADASGGSAEAEDTSGGVATLSMTTLAEFAPLAVALAGVDGGGFEIDGNFVLDSDGTKDWATVDYTSVPDAGLVYVGGQSGFEANRDVWEFQEGSASPPKDDLFRGYVNTEVQGSNAWLRVAAERAAGQGTAWASFEFNQANDGPFVSGTSVPRVPSVGDLLVSFQFPGSAQDAPEVEVEEWNGTSWVTTAVTALGAANASTISSLDGPESLAARQFMEVSVDISFLLGPDAGCRSFGQVWVRSNTAKGEQGQLKDVLSPTGFDFNTCANVTLVKQDTEGRELDGAVLQLVRLDDPQVIGTCVTPEGCFFDDLEPGTYLATELAPPPGYQPADPSSQQFTLGQLESATIVFTNPRIDYEIEVVPDGVNLVDESHTFTVTLTSEGDPVGGATVELEWLEDDEPAARITQIVDADPARDFDPAVDSEVCVTDGDGQCTVTVSSAEVTTGDLIATWQIDPAYQHATDTSADPPSATDGAAITHIAASAAKTWIDFLLTIDPEEAVNALGDPHTFTLTLTQLSPAGDSPVAGAEVAFGLTDDSVGSITEIDGEAQPDGTTDGTCTTDDDGTCAVTITSLEAGTSVLTASFEAAVGEASRTFSAEATKFWAAIDLVKTALIDPDAGGLKSVVVVLDPDGEQQEVVLVTYEYLVTNIGPVTLTDLTLEDDVLGSITLSDTVLEPGQSTTAMAQHEVSAEDLAAGLIHNVATVTGLGNSTEVTAQDDETVFLTVVMAEEQPPPVVVAEVTPPAPLPVTGAEVETLLLLGLLLAALGASTLLFARREATA